MAEKTLLISIDNAAMAIENALQKILRPYPEGIYIKGNELPSVVPGEYFYRVDRLAPKRLNEIEVRTLDDVLGNVFNEDGEIVISDRIANSKTRLLSNLPTVPAYGRIIVRAVIKDILDYMQIYKNVGPEHHHLQTAFDCVIHSNYKDNKTYRQFEDIVEQHTQDYIYTEINSWLGNRTWDVLVLSTDRDTAKIDNMGDYRIHKYMEEHGHEHKHR